MTTSTSKTAAVIQPYLFFRGKCEEAIEHYKSALGAEVVTMMRFGDSPDSLPPGMPAIPPERIMHATLRIAGAEIMMSDGWASGPLNFECMAVSLSVPSEAEVDLLFDGLAKEGTVEMPVGTTFFSPRFGSLTDKFGVSWMVGYHPEG